MNLPDVAKRAFGDQMGPNVQKPMPCGSPSHQGLKNCGLSKKKTLLSLLNQTYAHFEILIGIDGTKDNSLQIAHSFNDPRIKIFEHSINLGLAENVNYLISKASNDSTFYAMAEQDDIYVLERLEWQIAVMENHPNVGLVSGIAEFISDRGSLLFPGILVYKNEYPIGVNMFKYLYKNQLKVVNTCMLWRKSIHLDKKLQFNNTYGNFNIDWDYILRFSLKSQIFGIPKVLVKMNRRKSHISITSDKVAQHNASRQLLKDYKIEFSEYIDDKLYKIALKNHCKIELGHYSKWKIYSYSLFYFIKFKDCYFLKYLIFRTKKYFKFSLKNHNNSFDTT